MKKNLLSLLLCLILSMLMFPAEALAEGLTTISSIDVNIKEPIWNEAPQAEYVNEDTAAYNVTKIEWRDAANQSVLYTEHFKAGDSYIAYVYVEPKAGYEFADGMTVNINGKSARMGIDPSTGEKNYRIQFTNTPIGKSGNTWLIDHYGCLHIMGEVHNESSLYYTGNTPNKTPWKKYKDQITSVKVVSGASIDNCAFLFYEHSNLESVDLSGLDTSKVTSMVEMFYNCPKLHDVNLNAIDVSSVTDISAIFMYCKGLITLDLSGWNIQKLQKMDHMFTFCNNIEKVEMGSITFDPAKTSSAVDLFFRCDSLNEIRVTGSVLSTIWEQLVDVSDMWINASTGKIYIKDELKNLSLNADLAVTLVAKEQDDVVDCGAGWYLDTEGCLYITGAVENESQFMDDLTPWKDYKSSIKTVVTQDGAAITNGLNLFANCTNLVSADLSKLNTAGTTNMSNMFHGCSSLTTLNMSGLKTGDVITMVNMFRDCSSLQSMNLSTFDTSNLRGMGYIFADCSSLTNLDLRGLDISGLTVFGVDYMLSGCLELSEVRSNSDLLTKLSDQLLTISGQWMNNSTGVIYKNAADFANITGTAILVKVNHNDHSYAGDGSITPEKHICDICGMEEYHDFLDKNSANCGGEKCTICGELNPSYVKLPVITTQPVNVTAAAGATVTFKVTATDAKTYQWQYSKDGGKAWTNSTATSAKSATLSFAAKETYSGRLYRCVVTNDGGSVNSNSATLTVKATAGKPAIITQPANKSVKDGATAKFSVVATDAKTYQWQFSKDGGKTWSNSTVTSAKTANLSFTAKESYNGRLYRCVVANDAGSVNSNTATLTVTAAASKPVITTQPANVTVATGTTAKFSVAATGEGLTYQWKVSKDGGSTWANSTISSAKTATLSFTASASYSGRMYRCVVSNAAGSVTTKDVTLTVSAGKPVITTQPVNVTVETGKTAKFSVVATGDGLTYQWKVSKDGGKTWSNSTISSAKTATLSFAASASYSGRMYRCVVSNASGSVTTKDVTLTVSAGKPVITAQPANATAENGKNVKFSVTATGAKTYQWQVSTDGGKTWTDSAATSAKTATLSFTAKTSYNGRVYRCVITNDAGSVNSASATLTVK